VRGDGTAPVPLEKVAGTFLDWYCPARENLLG